MYRCNLLIIDLVTFSHRSLGFDFVLLRANVHLCIYKEIFFFAISCQPSNMDRAKPTYTFLQKQSSGCYSLSITSNPDEEWREVRHTGPVQKYVLS